MPQQRLLDLFRRPDPEDAVSAAPVFWIEEVRLLKSFSANPNEQIRDPITFQKGLNIIWAPSPPMSQRQNINFAGHAAGKTTLCRLIRYLLGEKNIAAPGVKEAIEENFYGGWIVGKIHVLDQPWIVARPLHHLARPRTRCIKSNSFEELLENPEASLSPRDFLAALEAATRDPLPVSHFGDGINEISFDYIIQWLTRDQDCHLTKLSAFRHPDSKSESPNLLAEPAHFLQRVLLNLADTDLQKAITDCEKLEKEAKKLPADKEYQQRREREMNAYLEDVGVKEKKAPNLTAILIDSTIGRTANLREQRTKPTRQAIELAKSTRITLNDELQMLQQQLGAVKANAITAKAAVDTAQKKIDGLKSREYSQEIAREEAKRMPPVDRCRVHRAHAEKIQCPAFLELDALAQNEEEIAALIKTQESKYTQELAKCRRNLNHFKEEEKHKVSEIAKKKKTIASIDGELEKLQKKLTSLNAPFTAIETRINDLIAVLEELAKIEDRETGLEKEVAAAKDLQEELQKRHKKTEGFFIDEFAWTVAQIFGGEETDTKCKFTREQITISISYHGKDLTSAAVTALKNLSFDIAAMTFSCRGRGHHPRFLLHDSPREADMGEAPYGRIFDLIIKQANECPNFQHIITTTSAPPEEYRKLPYLRLELNSSESIGRLFKLDL